MALSVTDSITQEVVVQAPIERVWRAVSDSAEFGEWFGMTCDRTFEPGVKVGCAITKPKEYAGMAFPIWIEAMEPPTHFSFRWHPYVVETDDLSLEPTTLITFTLQPHPDGTHLTIVESGFDDVPLDRRAGAFGSSSEGWRVQVQNVAEYVATHA